MLAKSTFHALIATGLFIYPVLAFAQESNDVEISFDFQNENSSELPVFIYAKGELVGTVPGIVEISDASAPLPIEIGIPQMDVPLYSFIFDPLKVPDKIVAVTSEIAAGKSASKTLWASVDILPTSRTDVGVEQISNGHFKIKLPPGPYTSYAQIWMKSGISMGDAAWLGFVPRKNYDPGHDSVQHYTFNKDQLAIETVDIDRKKTWAGAFSEPTKTQMGLGLPILTENWRIKSVPEGADIITDRGSVGATNAEITMETTSSTIVVLKLAGFTDCPCPSKKCPKSRTDEFTEVSCKLKKAK